MPRVDRRLLPPGPRAPAWVNTYQLAQRPIESLLGWHDRYGDAVTVPLLIFGTGVYVRDPDAIRDMFTGDQSDLHAGEANAPLSVILGERSVLVLDGEEHLRQRRLLLPPFHGSAVRGYRDTIREVAEAEVDRWQPGQRLVMRERMRALTFEVIARVVFGVTEPERIQPLREALTALVDAAPLALLPGPGRRVARLKQRADALVYEEIARRRAAADLAERDDVLSLLLAARDEEGRPLSDVELRDELMTMLLAGHETTATALAFAVDLILHEPAVRARLEDELDDEYLDALATETLRLRPVIDAAERTLTRPRAIAGHELPAGIRVYPNIVAVHLREDLYPEPLAFRPERFLDGRTTSYSWLPFGGGIRRCIGASLAQTEMVEVLRVILSRVTLRAARPALDPVVMRGITLVPRHGVEVDVIRASRTASPRPSSRSHA